MNANRDQVNEELDKAICLISTNPDETSGLNVFEALQRGTPVYLVERNKGEHASWDFDIDLSLSITSSADGPLVFHEAWSSNKYRNALQWKMKDKWTRERYRDELMEIINDIRQNLHSDVPKNTQSANLEEFT